MERMRSDPATDSPDNRGPGLYFLTVFWGATFRTVFLDVCLPSLLSPKNIPYLTNKRDSRFIIVTTAADWIIIRDHPSFRRLATLVEPVMLEMPAPEALDRRSNLLLSSAGHRMATAEAFKARACTMVVAPDVIFSDGTVKTLQERAIAGFHVVLALGMRAEQDKTIAELKQRGMVAAGEPITLPPRAAVDLFLRNMHSESIVYEWDAAYYTDWPAATWWRIPDNSGIAVRSVGWTPIFVNYSMIHQHRTKAFDANTIDGCYLYDNFGADPVFDVITDSDQLMQLSLTREADQTQFPLRTPFAKRLPRLADYVKLGNLRVFVACYIDPLRRNAFRRTVRVHTGEIDEKIWRPVEVRAGMIVDAALRPSSRFERLIVGLLGIAAVRDYQQLRNWCGNSLPALSPGLRLFLLRARFLLFHPIKAAFRLLERIGVVRRARLAEGEHHAE
jgi:hypothetical protein